MNSESKGDGSQVENLTGDVQRLADSIEGLRRDVRWSASLIAAAHLVAVDAARSEVYATLMDEQLLETAVRLAKYMTDKMDA